MHVVYWQFVFREFTMAEIEHFCDPRDKSHPKFVETRNTVMKLYSACNQMDGKSAESMTIGEAVDKVFIIALVKNLKILLSNFT